MAFRMQTSAPGTDGPRRRDGGDARRCTASKPGKPSFADNACWRGGWSSAACASCSSITPTGTITAAGREPRQVARRRSAARSISRSAALVQDLKQRGLLDDTLVVWGGEFGRTPMGEPRDIDRPRSPHRRLHHVAGRRRHQAGLRLRRDRRNRLQRRRGRVHVHDLQATILHLLGLDHTQLTYRFQGRDFRLTDVPGKVVKEILV